MVSMHVVRYILMGSMGVTGLSIMAYQGVAFVKAFMSLHQ